LDALAGALTVLAVPFPQFEALMRLTRKAVLCATFALASVFTLAACSDDSNDASADLSGDYVVTGFGSSTNGSTPVVVAASGTATLSFSTYNINITASATNPAIVSTGDYQAFQDGSFTQNGTTSIDGGPAIATQCTGTWAKNNEVTTLDSTCAGQRSIVQIEPAV
jgi:hypothetical protein